MLYEIALLLHTYTRWVIVIVMIAAVGATWWGMLGKREWGTWEKRLAAAFAMLLSIQFVFGVALYFIPNSVAQVALQDIVSSMRVRELRFFGLEHPLQMVIALGLVHLGAARSRKAPTSKLKYRWAAWSFAIATILILTAIPWWRPLSRVIVAQAAPAVAETTIDLSSGDAERGAVLFAQPVNGQPACSTCHALDNTRIVGPGMAGIATHAQTRVAGEGAVGYLYTSIVNPSAYVVEGYPNVMPATFADRLDEAQIRDLVAYLLTFEKR
jgi:mono/diheme cytochrome c family protein